MRLVLLFVLFLCEQAFCIEFGIKVHMKYKGVVLCRFHRLYMALKLQIIIYPCVSQSSPYRIPLDQEVERC